MDFHVCSIQDDLLQSTVLKLLDPKTSNARVFHSLFGHVGQLFQNFDEAIAIPKGNTRMKIIDPNRNQNEVFDNNANQWVPLTDDLFRSIPKTFTFAPKPVNVDMELDYYVRGAGLIKHSFIWATDAILKEHFSKIASNKNKEFIGRYTLTPWMPKISNLGRMLNGWYVIDDEDWEVMYGDNMGCDVGARVMARIAGNRGDAE